MLLTCSRMELQPDQADRVRAALDEEIDWDALLFYARLHSVAPLLHHHLGRVAPEEQLPAGARRRLLCLYQRAAYQNRAFADENWRIARAFGVSGVPLIAQKGLPLVELVYGSPAIRPLIDLVFLVPQDGVATADSTLREGNYEARPVRPIRALYGHCCPQRWYTRDGQIRFAVLLQWGLINWPRAHRIDEQEIWAEARPWPGRDGPPLLLLSAEDLVIYLCTQADNHGYFNRAALGRIGPEELLLAEWTNNRLIRFTDVREVVRWEGDSIDWDTVARKARSRAVDDAVYATLTLTERLLGPAAPPEVLTELDPSSGSRARRALLHAAWSSTPPPTEGAPRRGLPSAAWALLGPRRQLELLRAVSLGELVFPPREVLDRLDRGRSRSSLPLRYAAHTARTLLPSLRGFAAALPQGLVRLVRRWTAPSSAARPLRPAR